jgi:hypothetical protein
VVDITGAVTAVTVATVEAGTDIETTTIAIPRRRFLRACQVAALLARRVLRQTFKERAFAHSAESP